MSRYIDAEKIEQVFKSKIPFKYLMASSYDAAVENAFKIVDILNAEIPTADVTEVVRGKDCVFSRELDDYEKKIFLESSVCSYDKRKTEEYAESK